MTSEFHSTENNSAPVFGFLDEKTQVFYAFESFEEYQLFLEYAKSDGVREGFGGEGSMVDEEELRRNEERATSELMEIFEDPFFGKRGDEGELREINF